MPNNINKCNFYKDGIISTEDTQLSCLYIRQYGMTDSTQQRGTINYQYLYNLSVFFSWGKRVRRNKISCCLARELNTQLMPLNSTYGIHFESLKGESLQKFFCFFISERFPISYQVFQYNLVHHPHTHTHIHMSLPAKLRARRNAYPCICLHMNKHHAMNIVKIFVNEYLPMWKAERKTRSSNTMKSV